MNKYTNAEMNLLESTVAWNCVNCNYAGNDCIICYKQILRILRVFSHIH